MLLGRNEDVVPVAHSALEATRAVLRASEAGAPPLDRIVHQAPSIGSSHERVGELFHAALDLPVERRAEFLEGACGTDGDLRSEVVSLLAAHAQLQREGIDFRARIVGPGPRRNALEAHAA